jgi:transcriptional regulator ATRX
MQRLDYNVLVPYLQPKLEYVLSINMTDMQRKLYKFYLENYAKAGQVGLDGRLEGGRKGGLFYDSQNLARIWNHPYILQLAKNRRDEKVSEERPCCRQCCGSGSLGSICFWAPRIRIH